MSQDRDVRLNDKSIVHLISLNDVNKDNITVKVRMLTGDTQFRDLET